MAGGGGAAAQQGSAPPAAPPPPQDEAAPPAVAAAPTAAPAPPRQLLDPQQGGRNLPNSQRCPHCCPQLMSCSHALTVHSPLSRALLVSSECAHHLPCTQECASIGREIPVPLTNVHTDFVRWRGPSPRRQPSAAEEVLLAALRDSRRNILGLQRMYKDVRPLPSYLKTSGSYGC